MGLIKNLSNGFDKFISVVESEGFGPALFTTIGALVVIGGLMYSNLNHPNNGVCSNIEVNSTPSRDYIDSSRADSVYIDSR